AAPAAGTSVRRPGVVARRTAVEGQQGAVRQGMGTDELAEGRGALRDVLERLPGRAETGEDRVEDTGAPLERGQHALADAHLHAEPRLDGERVVQSLAPGVHGVVGLRD